MALPRTGLEQRIDAGKLGTTLATTWTSFAEEAAYFSALLDELPQIDAFTAGQGSTGLPIIGYRLGTGARRVLLLAQQHANEPSGRDALMTLLREWATTTDSTITSYLSQVTLIVIPTARPDSLTIRETVNGVNPNRDHVQLTQAEVRAYQNVISDYTPDLIVDVHEGRNINAVYATSKALNPNIHPDLLALSAEIEQSVVSAIQGAGYTWEPYQNWNITGPEYLGNAGGIRHAVSLLLESRRPQNASQDYTQIEQRWDAQKVAIRALLEWHRRNLSRATSAVNASRLAPLDQGSVELVTGTSRTGPIISPVPTGYALTRAQRNAIQRHVSTFGLQVADADEGVVVAADNDTATLVHYLVNPNSEQYVVQGVPLTDNASFIESEGDPDRLIILIGTPDGPRQVLEFQTMIDGERRTVTLSTVIDGDDDSGDGHDVPPGMILVVPHNPDPLVYTAPYIYDRETSGLYELDGQTSILTLQSPPDPAIHTAPWVIDESTGRLYERTP